MPLDVDATSVRGVWFRHTPARGKPLFRPEHPDDGRWQRGEIVEGFYLADSEETAWAEWYRALAERGVPPMRQIPRDLWRFEVDLPGVADLATEAQLARVGLPLPTPDRLEWPRFQAVGEGLFAEGRPGVLYPAAAREGGRALCLFRTGARLRGVKSVRPPVRYTAPPVPPRGLRA
jgi:RES domain-containing protein